MEAGQTNRPGSVSSLTSDERVETAERFDPSQMRGDLIEAEHIARYRFARSLAHGRRVLDAGCGWAYGCEILAGAGAAAVTGVDLAESVVDAAAGRVDPSIRLEVGDVRDLPFADDSFDLVVCFEVIEHIEQGELALAEFARVLTDDGLLVISSPNDPIYGDRNEHHVKQYTPAEFDELIARQFAFSQQLAQQNWITSRIGTLEELEASELELVDADLLKLVARERGQQGYLIAVASNLPLPPLAGSSVLTIDTELLKWLELWEEQDRYLRQITAERDRLLGESSAAKLRLLEFEAAIAAERKAAYEFEFEVEQRDLEMQRMQRSRSWRLTHPLRTIKQLLFR